MFEDRFENSIRQFDQTLSERRTFVGLMKDMFPEESMQANLMISSYDLGIAEDLKAAAEIDRTFAHRYVKRLQNEQGTSKENAEWAISTWCVCYGKNILGKKCSVSIVPVESEKEESSDIGKATEKKPAREAAAHKRGVLPVVIGMREDGTRMVQDFGRIPHILVCGFSGTGKTNFVQTVLSTLAKEQSINKIGYLIFDSKSTDYSQFDHLPHMVGPVFNDQRQFFTALDWVRTIIMKRYSLFAAEKVNSLDAYNNRSTEKLPHIFVVIDDLYGLLYNMEKESVDSLKYLLMNGRQAGIHFIIVTSTPSTKVLQTGLLTNLPCRICFAVASKADSRTILDFTGAEELAVPGEIYFKIPGQVDRLRAVHMSEEDIMDIIIALDDGSSTSDSSLSDWLAGKKSSTAAETKVIDPFSDVNGYDVMLPQAVEVVMSMGSCSVSMLQRSIKLGYSRAARIVDQMEELGVVGPYEGAKPRSITIDRAGWEQLCIKMGYPLPAKSKSAPKKEAKKEVPKSNVQMPSQQAPRATSYHKNATANSTTKPKVDPQDSHDYSRVEVIYSDSTPNESYPTRPSITMPRILKKKKAPVPFWRKLLRAVGVLFVVLFVIGLINTGLQENKRGSAPSSDNKPTTMQIGGTTASGKSKDTATAKVDAANRNSFVIPANLVNGSATQADLDHFADEYSLTSAKKEEDGSVTLTSEKDLPQIDIDTFVAMMNEKCGKSGYTRFVSVSANDDHTVFAIVVNDVNLGQKERQAVSDLFLAAGISAVQSGENVESIRVEIVNMLGKVISATDTAK